MDLNLGFSATLFQCLSLHMLAFAILTSQLNSFKLSRRYTERSTTILILVEVYSQLRWVYFKSRYIIDAKQLYQWFVTLSLKNGCFQAYLLIVHTTSPSFHTDTPLRDLSWWSGLFPSRPWTLAPRVCLPLIWFQCSIRSFPNLRKAIRPLPNKSALPLLSHQKHSTYIDFVENQLKPSLKAYHS